MMSEKIECPKCKKMVKPKIIKSENMLIAVECKECGYDMKKEILEAMD